jgi:hypothetical protein
VHVRRLTLAFLCAVVGMLGLTDAAALAAAPETPETTSPAADITATTATLEGVLNPGATGEPGTYEFLYKASATECEAGSTAPESPGIALGLEKETVPPVQLTGLEPGTQYTFCLLARNTAEEVSVGPAVTFTTSTEAPKIDSEYATEVTASSATLGAEVNPGGEETTYHFEYGTTEAYDQSTPESSSIGSNGTDDPAHVQIQNLLPDTVYHYQIVASNSKSAPGGTPGHDHTFKTQVLAGGGAVLPDGRAWELVSPVEKLGAQVLPKNDALIQAAEDGDAISYYMESPFSDNASANDRATQVISKRGPSGWSTEDISTPHDKATGFTDQEEYDLFSSDLTEGAAQPIGETPLSQEAAEETPYEQTPYVRDNETGAYTALVRPGNVPPGISFGQETSGHPGVRFVTATPDFSHIVLTSPYALTTNSSFLPQGNYYEWTAGQLKLITALPAGTPSLYGVDIGYYSNMRNAISNDGSRVFWSTIDYAEPDHLYMTDMTDGQVVRLDEAQGVSEPSGGGAHFQIASSDGSLVFFSDEAQLTTSPGGGLYVYNVETEKLTLVTNSLLGEDEFSGVVLGAAENGSDVYFVDGSVLSDIANARGEVAKTNSSNLYVLRREMHGAVEIWTPSFVTDLSANIAYEYGADAGANVGDENDWRPKGDPNAYKLATQTVEVSPNGQYLAFMSERSLTGYDNRDASSGEPDEEVYLYDAAGEHLVCASCNPTGARPAGWLEPQVLSDQAQAWEGRWVAAAIPGRSETSDEFSALYERKYLTNTGRLFFDSRDALVPQDVNGVGDVYEYESAGEGSCESADTDYSEKAAGCVSLISSGTGPDESVFADASANGDDVFFVTTDRLVAGNPGTEYDMYDARVCSTEAPCPSSVVTPALCATADACKAATTPQPELFGAPPSATFNGAGNVMPTSVTAVKAKAKPLDRGQKLARALKVCKKKPKQKRPACEKQARRRYGPRPKSKNTDGRDKS